MTFEEKRVWIMAVVTVGAYAIYLMIILGRAENTPLVEVSYAWPLLWTIVAAIGATIVLHIVVAIASPQDADKKDQRDREISRFGEYIGQSFVVIGAVAAFVLSSILGCVAKIVAYRRGFQPW